MDVSLSGIDFGAFRDATSEAGLHGCLDDLANRLGFDHFIFCSHETRSGRLGSVINGYPVAWTSRYLQNNYLGIDPVIRHCLRSVTPLIWHPSAFAAEEERAFMHEAGEFGVKAGMSFSVRGRCGAVSILSFAADSESHEVLRHMQSYLAIGQLLACHVHEATVRLLGRDVIQEEVHLSTRELECIKWAAAGKSNWQIGRIMNISEHGVGFHFRNIFSKLGVRTRQQAIVRTMRLGLL